MSNATRQILVQSRIVTEIFIVLPPTPHHRLQTNFTYEELPVTLPAVVQMELRRLSIRETVTSRR